MANANKAKQHLFVYADLHIRYKNLIKLDSWLALCASSLLTAIDEHP